MPLRLPRLVLLTGLLACCPAVQAQPTYKLGVKPDLKPRATLSLEGQEIRHSPLSDDPGFRLQLHFTQGARSVATVEARSSDRLRPALPAAGTYSVVLELFHPGYKGGKDLKGKFVPVSVPLTFRYEPGKPLQLVPTSVPPAPVPASKASKP